MATMIKCPSCSFEFPLEEALNDELKDTIEKEKADLRQKMAFHIQAKENEFKKQEAALQLQLLSKDKEIDEKLLIEKNKLQFIPDTIGNLLNLEWLYLSENDLMIIPHEIGNLTKLTRLIINNNK